MTDTPSKRILHSRPAFTMVELVVVIGIILTLAALLLPMLNKAYREAARSRLKADLGAIAAGLEAYKLDQRDYPRTPAGETARNGAVLLCWALIAPGSADYDGNDGPGFRTRGKQGQVYGPYIQTDRFKLADISTAMAPMSPPDNTSTVLLDRYGMPIYYCPKTPNTSVQTAFLADATGGIKPMYDYNYFKIVVGKDGHNANWTISLDDAQRLLGDVGSGTVGSLPDGMINPTETPVYTGEYLLWSAGPNTYFGHNPSTDPTIARGIVSDDVTNFRN